MSLFFQTVWMDNRRSWYNNIQTSHIRALVSIHYQQNL